MMKTRVEYEDGKYIITNVETGESIIYEPSFFMDK